MALILHAASPGRTESRVREIVSRFHDVETVTPGSIHAYVRDRAVSLVILDGESWGSGEELLSTIRLLRAGHHRTPLLVALRAERRPRLLLKLGRAEIEGIEMLAESVTSAEIMHRVTRCIAQGFVGEIMRRLPGSLTRWERLLFSEGLKEVHIDPKSADLARGVGLTRRKLAKILGERRLPRPARILMWCRLMVADHIVAEAKRSGRRAAAAVGYVNHSSFFRAYRSAVGRSQRQAANPAAHHALEDELRGSGSVSE